MNRLITGPLVALALCSTTAAAETPNERRCAALASLAATIATAHQEQVPLAELLAATSSDSVIGSTSKTLALKIYAEPRFSTEKNQQRFINKWRDGVHVACLVSKEHKTVTLEDPA